MCAYTCVFHTHVYIHLCALHTKVADFKSKMEMWGLMRLAFSSARVALSKSGITQIAAKSFTGGAGSIVCACMWYVGMWVAALAEVQRVKPGPFPHTHTSRKPPTPSFSSLHHHVHNNFVNVMSETPFLPGFLLRTVTT